MRLSLRMVGYPDSFPSMFNSKTPYRIGNHKAGTTILSFEANRFPISRCNDNVKGGLTVMEQICVQLCASAMDGACPMEYLGLLKLFTLL
jgi:hypothetical protein